MRNTFRCARPPRLVQRDIAELVPLVGYLDRAGTYVVVARLNHLYLLRVLSPRPGIGWERGNPAGDVYACSSLEIADHLVFEPMDFFSPRSELAGMEARSFSIGELAVEYREDRPALALAGVFGLNADGADHLRWGVLVVYVGLGEEGLVFTRDRSAAVVLEEGQQVVSLCASRRRTGRLAPPDEPSRFDAFVFVVRRMPEGGERGESDDVGVFRVADSPDVGPLTQPTALGPVRVLRGNLAAALNENEPWAYGAGLTVHVADGPAPGEDGDPVGALAYSLEPARDPNPDERLWVQFFTVGEDCTLQPVEGTARRLPAEATPELAADSAAPEPRIRAADYCARALRCLALGSPERCVAIVVHRPPSDDRRLAGDRLAVSWLLPVVGEGDARRLTAAGEEALAFLREHGVTDVQRSDPNATLPDLALDRVHLDAAVWQPAAASGNATLGGMMVLAVALPTSLWLVSPVRAYHPQGRRLEDAAYRDYDNLLLRYEDPATVMQRDFVQSIRSRWAGAQPHLVWVWTPLLHSRVVDAAYGPPVGELVPASRAPALATPPSPPEIDVEICGEQRLQKCGADYLGDRTMSTGVLWLDSDEAQPIAARKFSVAHIAVQPQGPAACTGLFLSIGGAGASDRPGPGEPPGPVQPWEPPGAQKPRCEAIEIPVDPYALLLLRPTTDIPTGHLRRADPQRVVPA